MARPLKNNADYFTHDAMMRNHRKIKALRSRFQATGYAFWCMMLELLTDSDNFQIDINDQELELISCDFDIPVDALKLLIDYCVKLNLLQVDNDVLTCLHLQNRFSGLLEKRQRDRERLQKYKDQNDIASENPATTNDNDNIAGENDIVKQSKVKQSTVKQSKKENILSDPSDTDNVQSPPPVLPGMEMPPVPEPLATEHTRAGGTLMDRFNEFWKAYPRKEGKGACRKWWERKRPSQELLKTMLAAIEIHKQTPKWKENGGKYIAMPATWLNQERWEDEVEIAGGGDESPSLELRRAGILPSQPLKLTDEQLAALGITE